jgi:SWI/SNF-related matrix-associated actin-dependent regulator of chromatin subfamily B member 1
MDEAPSPAAVPDTPARRGRANSSASTSSSASEPPLARRMRSNGASAKEKEDKEESNGDVERPSSTVIEDGSTVPAPAAGEVPDEELPPAWLTKAVQETKLVYPDDRFEIVSRVGSSGDREWRMRCIDCPGKVCFSFEASCLTTEN